VKPIDFILNGRYSPYFWDKSINKNADIENGLANCTTMVIGLCLLENNPYPVSRIVSASRWHEVLINDWKCIPFDFKKVKVGDIIQWTTKGHVCKVSNIVDGKIYIRGSFYTGEHGVAYYNGGYDTRPFQTLQELSDFMFNKYPERLFHEWTLDTEIQYVGGEPNNILVLPNTLVPVEKDSKVNQVETTDNTLRIREEPNLNSKIIGHVSIGYYDVLDIKEATQEDRQREPSLKCWYEISPNRWIGNVTTIYHEASQDEDLKKIISELIDKMSAKTEAVIKERDDYKERLLKIKELTEGI
jgi:hypothetical protein